VASALDGSALRASETCMVHCNRDACGRCAELAGAVALARRAPAAAARRHIVKTSAHLADLVRPMNGVWKVVRLFAEQSCVQRRFCSWDGVEVGACGRPAAGDLLWRGSAVTFAETKRDAGLLEGISRRAGYLIAQVHAAIAVCEHCRRDPLSLAAVDRSCATSRRTGASINGALIAAAFALETLQRRPYDGDER
jgi:hypothetical protein